MVDTTINGLTATTSAVAADEIPIWVVGSAVTRKITKANLMGGALTGGGTVATGGYTLTVPATGTAALWSSGIWYPALVIGSGNTGLTYAADNPKGRYIKLGDMCWFGVEITLTAKGSSTGQLYIGGLPFTAATPAIGGAVPTYFVNMASITGEISAYIAATALVLNQMTASGISGLTHANLTDSSTIIMWGCYQVA